MSAEIWHVVVNGVVYQADLETLKSWLLEGRIRPDDKVQKGSLPWTAAKNVPALREICASLPPSPIQMMPMQPMLPPIPQSAPQYGQGQFQPQPVYNPHIPYQLQQPGSLVSRIGPGLRYLINAAGFEGRQLIVQGSGMFSGAKLFLDSQPAPKGTKRGLFLLRRNDGREVEAQLRSIFLDPVPKLTIDGQKIELEPPLQWYEWVWMCLPMVLLLLGGGIGGFLGGLSMAINTRIFRANIGNIGSYLASAAVSGGAVIVYLVLVVALFGASGKIALPGLSGSKTVTTNPSQWQPFMSPDGMFSIAMPIPPTEQTQELLVGTTKLDQHLFTAEINHGTQTFLVSYIDYRFDLSDDFKGSDPQKMLNRVCEATIGQMKGTINDKQAMKLGKFQALSYTADASIPGKFTTMEVNIWGRIYLVHNRVYSNMAIVQKGTMSAAQGSQFLDSFKDLDD